MLLKISWNKISAGLSWSWKMDDEREVPHTAAVSSFAIMWMFSRNKMNEEVTTVLVKVTRDEVKGCHDVNKCFFYSIYLHDYLYTIKVFKHFFNHHKIKTVEPFSKHLRGFALQISS